MLKAGYVQDRHVYAFKFLIHAELDFWVYIWNSFDKSEVVTFVVKMQGHLYVCVQVPNGVGWSRVDQPHPHGQTRAGDDP